MPNYYTRFLNGLGNTAVAITDSHLAVAKRILTLFDGVFFLNQDRDEVSSRIAALLHVSNFTQEVDSPIAKNEHCDPFSEVNQVLHRRYVKDNRIDYELMKWAADHFNITLVERQKL